MLKKLSSILLIITATALTGCATNADVGSMAYSYQGQQSLYNNTLKQNITVGSVSGGHETNPIWTSQINDANFKTALQQSLKSAFLYAGDHNGKYVLNAKLIMLSQPLIGFNLTVNCVVNYKLYKQGVARPLFDRDISSSYTAKTSDAFLATTRLKIANEGAARTNIQQLIAELYRLQ